MATTTSTPTPAAFQKANINAGCVALSQNMRDLFSAANNAKPAANMLKLQLADADLAAYSDQLGINESPSLDEFISLVTQIQERVEPCMFWAFNLNETCQQVNLAPE